MRKNYCTQWMLAAILFCGLLTTSCTDEQFDNPSSDQPEQASAVDPGRWWIDESYMDKTVKLSDNFFMYCVGTWWKNTTLGPLEFYISRLDGIKPSFSDRVNALTDDNYAIYKNHLKWADPKSEAAASAEKLYEEVLAQSGLMAATTAEDVLRAFGKMSTLGVSSFIRLEPFSHNGKLCLYSSLCVEEYTEEAESDPASERQRARKSSFQQQLNENPELLSHFVPVGGKSGTRGISAEWSFVQYILEGMGIDPEMVYVSDDYMKFMGNSDFERNSLTEELRRLWQNALEKNDVDLLKTMVIGFYQTDYGFISQEAREEYDIENNKPDDTDPAADDASGKKEVLSLKVLEKSMNEQYLPYLRSKMVADQLVPAGLKEDYLPFCKEMKDVFAQRIKNNSWLSDGSKQNALDKLDAMVFNVGYPEHWIAAGLPDFSKSQSLLEDIYIIRKARLNLLKAIVGKSRAEESFTVVAMDKETHLGIENAFYYSNLNCMNILPFYIEPPFYDTTQSLAINYECLGTVGHEITHGFDSQGALFDKYGDYNPNAIWASQADKDEFDRRTALLVECYASFDVLPDEMPGVKAEGKVTLAENIADLGGQEIAYQAYLNRLSADGYTGSQLKLMKQRFFLAMGEEWRAKYGQFYVDFYAFGKGNPEGADGHSMNKERVNGVVSNMDGWYDAFDIIDGALYRAPANRIHIW